MSTYKKEFLTGVIYTSIAKYTGIFIQIGITMVLARLLDPEDFGVLAIASIFISFINLLTDFGLGPAIIQRDDLNKADLYSLFSLTFVMGLIASFILVCISFPIGVYYKSIDVQRVLMILSINTIFVALNIVPNALLLKAKRFKLISIRTLMMQITGGVLGIFFAYMGFGLYALVIQAISSALGILIFNYIQIPLPFFKKIRKHTIKKVLSFSTLQFISSLINFTTKSLDKPMVGKYLSITSLGYYEKSYRLMQLPIDNLSYVITPVMQPIFREFQNDMSTMFAKYKKILSTLAIIGLPLSATLYFTSYELIHIFYGGKWDMAVEPFRYLSIGAGFLILLSSSGPIYQASNNMKTMLIVNVTECVISLSCLFISLGTGEVNIVAIAISIGIILRFVSVFLLLSYKVFKISFWQIVKAISPGIGCAIIVTGLNVIFQLLNIQSSLFVSLLIKCGFLFLLVGSVLLTNKNLGIKTILK